MLNVQNVLPIVIYVKNQSSSRGAKHAAHTPPRCLRVLLRRLPRRVLRRVLRVLRRPFRVLRRRPPYRARKSLMWAPRRRREAAAGLWRARRAASFACFTVHPWTSLCSPGNFTPRPAAGRRAPRPAVGCPCTYDGRPTTSSRAAAASASASVHP